jgi:hypothetical protein
MTRKTIKNISIILVSLATILLPLDIVLAKKVDTTEVGLWDFMPGFLREAMFTAYPILLLTSYVLFIVTRKVKMKFDFIPNILFFLNGLFIVVLLVIYMTELVKHL